MTVPSTPNLLRSCFSFCRSPDDDDGTEDDTTLHHLSFNLNCCASHNTNYNVTDGCEKEAAEAEEDEDRRQVKEHLLQSETPGCFRERQQSRKGVRTEQDSGRSMVAQSTNVHLTQTQTSSL